MTVLVSDRPHETAAVFMAPAVAATRIVQGMARHGFTSDEIADMAGVPVWVVQKLLAGHKRQVLAVYAHAIRVAGDRVRLDVVPSGPSADRSRAAACRKGWVPLAAWDDIADPDARPVGVRRPPRPVKTTGSTPHGEKEAA